MGTKKIFVEYVDTRVNTADMFTKVVPSPKFDLCLKILQVGD